MSVTKRKGFAMILAIFVVVMVALGGALLLSNAAKGSKSISDNYLRAQAELLAQSATEYALMRAQGVDTTAGACLNQLNITVNDAGGTAMFDINISLAYSFENVAPATCEALDANLTDMTGKDTMVLIDATAVTRATITTEPIRAHRRSWQKL
ncbi:MAG: type II secretion system protein [Sulfuricurvum sp.]|uniref:type IV pilus modification PilV family protein n=1 Tax=Sulfuricurvum sp. TaxID=2025608 RepID=UPI002735F299|nr:type II secretion system protein [Sulfuricurvum sp.]MDP3290683.1 type II secretion system protein [Sulfuricurvum sp.]